MPLIQQGRLHPAWLSITYSASHACPAHVGPLTHLVPSSFATSARSLAVLWGFEALHAAGATARMSELRVRCATCQHDVMTTLSSLIQPCFSLRRLAQAVLRLLALVCCLAGTMLILEFLGKSALPHTQHACSS